MTTAPMRAYLDDEPLQLDGQTLGAAVLAGRKAAEEKGRMIVEVWADGSPAPAADLEEMPEVEPYADEVRFVSASPGALVAHAFEEAAENLDGAREAQVEAAAQLARGETADAMNNVATSLRIWESVRSAIQQGCSVLGVSPGELAGDDEATQGAINGLLEALREVQRAMADQDIAGLADTLEYDLDELAETWKELLGTMASTAYPSEQGSN